MFKNDKVNSIEFKKKFEFDKRKAEATRITTKFKGRIPVIVEAASSNDIGLENTKYLCPGDLSCGQFSYVIRKRTKLKPEEAMFMFVNNTIPATSELMSCVYDEHKDEDGFLYILLSKESVFGCIAF